MNGTLKSYITGFIASIILTLVAFGVVMHPEYFHMAHASTNVLLGTILALAIAQLTVQLLFFLHLGSQPGRRWKLTVFFTTLSLVLIIVIGSIWIMNHLNYNMTPDQINQYMQDQQGGF